MEFSDEKVSHKKEDMCSSNDDDDDDDAKETDDDEPLSKVRAKILEEDMERPLAQRRKRRSIKRKICLLDDDDSDLMYHSDDSVKDPTYKIKKEDIEDLDNEDDLKHIHRGSQNKSAENNTQARKKKTTLHNIRQKKPSTLNNTLGRPAAGIKKSLFSFTNKSKNKSSNLSALAEAKRRSLTVFRARNLIQKVHVETLDTLLKSNGLKRISMKGDGNCFFSALHYNFPSYENQAEIRKEIVQHLEKNIVHYIGFLSVHQAATEEERINTYHEQVRQLQNEGCWSNDLADALPLATANVLNRDLMIFSSNRSRPVLKIEPTIQEAKGDQLILAHTGIPGFEHYDACITLDISKLQHSPTKERPNTKMEMANDIADKCGTSSPAKGMLTPRKQAIYISPKKTFTSRKRLSKPSMWKKNVRKRLRLSGKEYIGTNGKIRKARKLSDINCSKCRYKCTTKISEEERMSIFDSYWNLKDYVRQKDFLCKNVMEKKPGRIIPDAKRPRKLTRIFSFAVNEKNVRVCKGFFMKTLDIGEKTIEYALKSKDANLCATKDRRGTHSPTNKTPEASLNFVKQHIESFPVMDPHYTRKDTKRKFLGSDINITRMYSCYKEECLKTSRKPVGAAKYRKVFCEDYNYSFHVPKKDQCRTCTLYNQQVATDDLSDDMKREYLQHIERKNRARQEKDFDKEFSKRNNHYHTVTFDLQAVLNTPCSNVSQVYYKRKLNSYNLCVYSLADCKASSYLWDETEGKRGSNEITSSLMLYLKSLPPTTKHVCFFSDSCSGQNRNRNVAIGLLHAVSTLDHVETIDQKYLEPGHTEMECDSMHAAIETAKRRTSIFIASQWDTIIRLARKRKPYTVIPLKYTDIHDFKSVADKCLSSSVTDTKGKKAKWMCMKWIQFRKRDANSIYFKYSFDEEEFHCLKLRSSTRKSPIQICDPMPRCYKTKLPISEAKKKDLLSLCNDGTIPNEYHSFYNNLPSCSNIKDSLPEPDLFDEESDTDNEN